MVIDFHTEYRYW